MRQRGDFQTLLKALDAFRRNVDDQAGNLAGVDAYTTQALDIITSRRAVEAFDVSREPAKVRERYDKATRLLLALRTAARVLDAALVLRFVDLNLVVVEALDELAVDLAIPMIGMLKRKAERRLIDGALKDLKKRVEG